MWTSAWKGVVGPNKGSSMRIAEEGPSTPPHLPATSPSSVRLTSTRLAWASLYRGKNCARSSRRAAGSRGGGAAVSGSAVRVAAGGGKKAVNGGRAGRRAALLLLSPLVSWWWRW